MNITPRELGWIAGFLEGEGTFRYRVRTPHMSAAQVQREPLDRLQRYVGGKIYWRPNKGNGIFTWDFYGGPAAGLMMTLYPMLSPRRKLQVADTLAQWKKKRTLREHYARRRAQTHCKRGHELAGDNIYIYKTHRTCKTCQRAWQKSHRKLKIAGGE